MARKAQKPSKGIIIAVIAIVLIIAIAVVIIYFLAPNVWSKLVSTLTGEKNGNNSGGNNGQNQAPALVVGEGELQFHMLNIGQGDCLFIILPDGKEMIVDCGSTSGGSYTYVKNYLDNYIDDGQIDYVVATHSDQDHVEYLDELFADYQIDNVYMPALYSVPTNTTLAAQVEAISSEKMSILDDIGLDKNKCQVTTATYAKFFIAAFNEPNCNINLNIDLDDNPLGASLVSSDGTYSITFFYMDLNYYNLKKFPGDSHRLNGISPTMILEYNSRRIVLTGDANEENEPVFTEKMHTYFGGVIDCDVLKVAHHGSHEGSSNEYLNEITCEYAMISCGLGNSYNHPRQVALDRLIAHNMDIYRTDLHGAIICKIDKDSVITFTPENTNVTQEQARAGLTPS